MTDKNQSKKNRVQDFLRYQNGEMSGKERNSFERKLQKDPFAEEALEGFALESTPEVSEDINHLRHLIKKSTQGISKNQMPGLPLK